MPARRRIRYAGPDEDGGTLSPDRPRIEYALTRPGARHVHLDPRDDPSSQDFIPLTERDERGRARWWAMQRLRKRGQQTSGEFDP